VKTQANYDKKSHLNSRKKITHVDDMMIHNLVKNLVQNRLRLWDIKITNFQPRSCLNDLLEIYYFYISQMKSSLGRIFYKIVFHHIIYMCDFFCEFKWLFCHGLHGFSRKLWFASDMFPKIYPAPTNWSGVTVAIDTPLKMHY